MHAGVNDGIHENCVAVAVLDDDISFGTVGEKRVRTVIVLGVRDKTRSALLDLAPIFESSENLRTLKDPGLTVEDVLAMHG